MSHHSASIAFYRRQPTFLTVDLTVKFEQRRMIDMRFKYLQVLERIEWELRPDLGKQLRQFRCFCDAVGPSRAGKLH
jgi:hypothetical protein